MSRIIYFYLAVIFALCLAVQVFLAGYAIFVDPVKWDYHTTFVKIFEYVPIFMLIVSFLGRLPASMRWLSFSLFLLIMLMYATASLTSQAPIAGAFHPVAALLIFWLSIAITRKAWRLAYQPAGVQEV
ncbi:DUF6220 domain-containing protein [Cohnella lubricantis]|uniref:DUF6220 domain-containing protein n=1 Tax=Cohnella lubricantis TaxID=2163172 RepID=UPI00289308FA|nr:DUF6220 domain-containing protein [Cohnella lubricantis]MBP2117454.1 membrane protein YdbS with pleckstrin-like domain [Cohnella lubricantis]